MPRKMMHKTETVSGRLLVRMLFPVAGSSLSGTGFLYLNPVIPTSVSSGGSVTVWGDGKLQALSSLFSYFRFHKWSARLLPSAAAVDAVLSTGAWETIAGFQPQIGSAGSGVGSVANLLNFPWTSDVLLLNADGGTVPSVPLRQSVPRDILLDGQPLKWWKTETVSGGVPSSDIVSNYDQGIFAVAVQSSPIGSSTFDVTVDVDIEYTVEFKDFCPLNALTVSSTPLVRSYRVATDLRDYMRVSHEEEEKMIPDSLEQPRGAVDGLSPSGVASSLSRGSGYVNITPPLTRLQSRSGAILPTAKR